MGSESCQTPSANTGWEANTDSMPVHRPSHSRLPAIARRVWRSAVIVTPRSGRSARAVDHLGAGNDRLGRLAHPPRARLDLVAVAAVDIATGDFDHLAHQLVAQPRRVQAEAEQPGIL